MLEILIMIGVVKAFASKAKEKNLSKNLWGFIGAASYYVPVLIMGLGILPALVLNGAIEVKSESSYLILSILLNVITGAVCCLIAFAILSQIEKKTPELDNMILDESLDV